MKDIKFVCNLCREKKTEAIVGIHFCSEGGGRHGIRPVQPLSAESHLCQTCVMALDVVMAGLKQRLERAEAQ